MQDTEALSRIAAAVTPAVMVSGCGLLALGLDNQAARMTGRLRELAREFRATDDTRRLRHIQTQTAILSQRHRLYTFALMANYTALLSFLLTSATALWSGAATQQPIMALFGGGVLLLATMAVCTLLSVRLSRRAIEIEEREVQEPDAPPSIIPK